MQVNWTQEKAIILARAVERIAPDFGCHVALTGGCLYRHGERKDCDLLFYRIRQADRIDIEGLVEALSAIGLEVIRKCGWVYKARFYERTVDLFFPDQPGEIEGFHDDY